MCERVLYVFPWTRARRYGALLEKIRGKLDERIHNHTLAEEYRIINEQIVKSQGFDVDFSKLRYLFDFQPAFLDDSDSDTGRDFFRKLSAEAIEIYNEREGTSFEFVEVEKANIYLNSGEVFFITFVAKDSWNQTKVFQAKVIHVFCREIVHSFCRLKPNQPVTCVDEAPIAETASISRKKKRKLGI
ncbi:unnamed protein product [Brassica rapa]|uniref:Cystatin domain-containing protein n=1 Tax=Brassica campestris TaxID=3711 RepID=A0A8D9I3M0_BRACM|nr:unnamed protein product [Brassica rapa]